MTHKEQLDLIKEEFNIYYGDVMSLSQKQYLIDRVDVLTKALERISSSVGHTDRCKNREYPYCNAGCELAEIASKALEEEK